MPTLIRDYEKHPIPSSATSYGARIDQLVYLPAKALASVYKLYGLTPEEIKIAENPKENPRYLTA